MDIDQTARQLGISPDGVRKRIARGSLQAAKVAGRWDVVQDTRQDTTGQRPGQQDTSARLGAVSDTSPSLVTVLQEQVKTLTQQLTVKDNMIAELLIVTRQAQAMLPPPPPPERRRGFWGWLWHGS